MKSELIIVIQIIAINDLISFSVHCVPHSGAVVFGFATRPKSIFQWLLIEIMRLAKKCELIC